MSWQDLGAIGDLVGGLAVVVSLVYVAYQIRQNSAQIEHNSRQLEAATYQQASDAFSRWQTLLAQDAELADLWRRGLAGEELGAVERTRFHCALGILFNTYENNFFQVQFGSMRRDTLNLSRKHIARVLRAPEAARWWHQLSPTVLTPEFRGAVERVVEVPGGDAGREAT
jgi:hypothetical protein